ncbi:hypothetical protein RCH23_003393 [Cryobacterium sp. CAN_C3]|nr:hypothetical protein [Cryobacterium sp. CAN_C3]
MNRNHAQGADAWDESGIQYSYQGAYVDRVASLRVDAPICVKQL